MAVQWIPQNNGNNMLHELDCYWHIKREWGSKISIIKCNELSKAQQQSKLDLLIIE